ncbi:MAG TPA: DUF6084 family protein [Thermoanaerobaculia bacterium]|nr:DUF6084 family protein [Thermoanaerobaculia bacterium]
MADLRFQVVGARAEPYAAVPTLIFTLRIEEGSGQPVQAIALRCQIQIEPHRRSHSAQEQARLLGLFGLPVRWAETVKPFLWSHANLMVNRFSGTTTVELPMACTYDFEVTAAKYFTALEEGEIPLLLLFSGTVFTSGGSGGPGSAEGTGRVGPGFMVERVPWEKEAAFRLPVGTWREVMDRYFPGTAWLRLRKESLDALERFKAERALPTWDDALAALLALAGGSKVQAEMQEEVRETAEAPAQEVPS